MRTAQEGRRKRKERRDARRVSSKMWYGMWFSSNNASGIPMPISKSRGKREELE
jgi:hypothetical protein